MKRHLSHSPHHWIARSARRLREGPIATSKDVVVLTEFAEDLGDPQFAAVAQDSSRRRARRRLVPRWRRRSGSPRPRTCSTGG